MKIACFSVAAAALLLAPSSGFGLGMERFGPSKDTAHPTVEQPGWPAGMVEVVDHDSRVYSSWVNGGEDFYFNATNAEVLELVQLFSEMRLRDHVVTIKPGPHRMESFHGERIGCNVSFEHLGGIVGATRRGGDTAETFEPTLVIYVGPDAPRDWWDAARVPDHVCVKSEIEKWPVASQVVPPERTLRFARFAFEDVQPNLDFRGQRFTRVTLWDDAEKPGIPLGGSNPQGEFRAAFSEDELKKLASGEIWLTLTVGKSSSPARPDDPKLDASYLVPDPMDVKAFTIARP